MMFKRHEFNTSFAWQGAKRPLRRLTDEQARDWDELGYFVVENAIE